ncbi:uncharacterized protein LOC144704612 [Wolffia australiana]
MSTLCRPPVLSLRPPRAQAMAPSPLRRPPRAIANLLPSSSSSISLSTSVGYAALPLHRRLLHNREALSLNLVAFAAVIASSWVFFAAIPGLLASRRAAETAAAELELAAEELPRAMAAARRSSAEICELAAELADLGREIGRGVRASAEAAKELRQAMAAPPVLSRPNSAAAMREEGEATAARKVRQGIVKGRSVLSAVLAVGRFSKWAIRLIAAARRRKNGVES